MGIPRLTDVLEHRGWHWSQFLDPVPPDRAGRRRSSCEAVPGSQAGRAAGEYQQAGRQPSAFLLAVTSSGGKTAKGREWMRSAACLLVMALSFASTACGNLSKEKAREILQKKYYDKDNEVSCSWKEPVSQEGSGSAVRYSAGTTSDNPKLVDWMKALDGLGIVKNAECTDKWRGVCTKAMFDLGPNASVNSYRLSFPCGTKSLGEVISVTTEGKTAMVKYKRSIKLDHATIEKLSDLTLDVPNEGEEELTRKFVKDDDGNWSDVNK